MNQDDTPGGYAGRSVAAGRYQLRDLLGQGCMASVHLAYDSVLDRQVAIKLLHTELGRDQVFRERFRREAKAMAKLRHTNIVSVFGIGEDDLGGVTTPYIVMEYVEGKPLGSVLEAEVAQHGAMPADKALKITADVLAALETGHEMGLVHRGIKPGNVMMTRRNVVKVTDFGIARAMQSDVTSMTQTGIVVGMPQYLAPEQVLGRGEDARSNVYSVGVMLFQLVTGRLPFDKDSPLAIAYAHVQEEPVAPSSINRSLPSAVDALVARALEKSPNERLPSAMMRGECLRVAQLLRPVAPSIVPGAQTPNDPGVGSAGFPVGSIDWQTVMVTMALAPFVQALASSFGTKLAGAIDHATRSAVRRFVRGQGESAAVDAQSAGQVMLLLEEHGVRVHLFEGTPAEALGQLPAVNFAQLEGFSESCPVVSWFEDAWCARGDRGGSPLVSAWDPAAGRWSHRTRTDG
ncbi:Serine/threonine-protein kinase PknB [Streptomyces platensis]|uniref:non-specific serine/threonine protein kinase n=1 Tax=Streptomyces platensis TaxID=58346 RepID=A0ABX3XSK0_STRPT|nr:protein kinase [Streptomyces platensis]OSY42592.1 Serine/threonine-protein kinase PknB [Streptomyces platensis]